MANTTIQLRYSTETGNVPVSLANGEIAINTQDGKLFYADPAGTVQEFSGFPGPSGLDTEIQFNDSGVLGANSRLTFNKTTGTLTVNGSVVANVFSADGTNLFVFSNNAFNQANSAFDAANTNAGSITVIQGIDDTQNTSITTAQNTADLAFNHANAAFESANNITGGNSFGVISVSGQETLLSETANSTLTVVAGSGITITTNNITKEITFSTGTTVSTGSAIFVNGADFDLVTVVADTLVDLGSITDAANSTVDLGSFYVTGFIRPDQLVIPSYNVSTLSGISTDPAGQFVFVTDEAGGSVVAFSDGSNWRRMTDRQIVS